MGPVSGKIALAADCADSGVAQDARRLILDCARIAFITEAKEIWMFRVTRNIVTSLC